MIKLKWILVFSIVYIFINANVFGQLGNVMKPAYGGKIVFTTGTFGSYNHPVSGDSIVVFLIDSTHINFLIHASNDVSQKRQLDLPMNTLKLTKKKNFQEINDQKIAVPTPYYDMKFIGRSAYHGGSVYTLTISHYGTGTIANMVLTEEHEGLRIDELFVASLVKLW